MTGDDDWHCAPADEFEVLFENHYQRVIRFVMHMGASQSDAEDAAQEAFCEVLVLVRSKPDDWLEIESKEAWIRTVALRRYRRPPGPRKTPLTVTDQVPEVPNPGPGHDEGVIQIQDVLRALRSLPEEERIVAAFDLDSIPAADIAREMGITEQRVRDVRKKYRAKLKRGLSGNGHLEGRQGR